MNDLTDGNEGKIVFCFTTKFFHTDTYAAIEKIHRKTRCKVFTLKAFAVASTTGASREVR